MLPAQPTTRPTDDAQTWAMFLTLAAIWGSSFLWIALALDEGMAPLSIVAMRTLFGSVLLAVVLLARGGRLPMQWNVWKRMLFLGTTNIVVPFALIAWGQQYIGSGMASILNATVPIFTMVLAAVALVDEHITPAKLAGLGIGFLGVVLLAWPSVDAAVGADTDAALALAGMLAVAIAGVFYAVASVYTRRRLTGMPIIELPDGTKRAPSAVEISLGSTVAAFLMVGALALVLERPAGGLLIPQSSVGWIAAIWLGALGTGIAYLLFFRLIERWGATRTTLVTYVIPIVAITLGFVFLGERLRPIELAGAALIIGGVVLVNGTVGQRRLQRRDAESQGAVEP